MRILQVIEFAAPAKGGSVEVARTTAEGLSRRGHEVELWTSAYGDAPLIAGVTMRRFRGPGLSGLYLTPGIVSPALASVRRFDVVHLHNVRSMQNAVVGLAAQRSRIPYVVSLHGALEANGQKAAGKKVFDAAVGTGLLRNAAAITTPWEHEARACEIKGLDPQRVTTVPNPVRSPGDASAAKVAETPTIGYLGRLDRSKAIDKLIAAFAIAHAQRSDLRLEIAGPDDGDEGRLRQIVSAAGLQRAITFRGYLYGADKWNFLAHCSVLANPCPFEVFGLVCFEALAQGTPVVVAQQSGAAHLARQSGAGVSVDPHDSQSFGRALLSQLDVPLSARYHASQFVRRTLSVDAYLDRIEKLYRVAVGAPCTLQDKQDAPARIGHGTASEVHADARCVD